MQLVAFRGSTFLLLRPRAVALTPNHTQQFTASSANVTWSVNGINGGTPSVGTITSSGLYTLTPSNVTSAQAAKLFSHSLDGIPRPRRSTSPT
jgi:hypothetical protein